MFRKNAVGVFCLSFLIACQPIEETLDISKPAEQYLGLDENINRKQLKELVGVDAFIYVWNRTKGYRWLGTFVALPVVKQLAIFAYSILAFLLFWRFKIFNKS